MAAIVPTVPPNISPGISAKAVNKMPSAATAFAQNLGREGDYHIGNRGLASTMSSPCPRTLSAEVAPEAIPPNPTLKVVIPTCAWTQSERPPH